MNRTKTSSQTSETKQTKNLASIHSIESFRLNCIRQCLWQCISVTLCVFMNCIHLGVRGRIFKKQLIPKLSNASGNVHSIMYMNISYLNQPRDLLYQSHSVAWVVFVGLLLLFSFNWGFLFFRFIHPILLFYSFTSYTYLKPFSPLSNIQWKVNRLPIFQWEMMIIHIRWLIRRIKTIPTDKINAYPLNPLISLQLLHHLKIKF